MSKTLSLTFNEWESLRRASSERSPFEKVSKLPFRNSSNQILGCSYPSPQTPHMYCIKCRSNPIGTILTNRIPHTKIRCGRPFKFQIEIFFKKSTLRPKHCDGDCFWRSVDGAANLKPISFFLINAAPELERCWKFSEGSARYRGNCGRFPCTRNCQRNCANFTEDFSKEEAQEIALI